MDVEELIARHPRVFHTMSATAWPSVQRHGLLSTQQLTICSTSTSPSVTDF
nr:hypothetical protein [Micromonospora sonchi]